MKRIFLLSILTAVLTACALARADEAPGALAPDPVSRFSGNLSVGYKSEKNVSDQILVGAGAQAIVNNPEFKTESTGARTAPITAVALDLTGSGGDTSNGRDLRQLSTGSAKLEVLRGHVNATSKSAEATQALARLSAVRDVGFSERWAALAAFGFQLSAGQKIAPLGTVSRLQFQPGFSGRTAILAEGGAGVREASDTNPTARLWARIETALQHCFSGKSENFFVCANLEASPKFGTDIGVAVDAGLILAGKMDDGPAGKSFVYIAPNAGAAVNRQLTDNRANINEAHVGAAAGLLFR